MLFVITIPSAIRYWYRELKYHRKGLVPPTMYDDIWFEGQATRWGQTYVDMDWCQYAIYYETRWRVLCGRA